jgi:hypothetical protein
MHACRRKEADADRDQQIEDDEGQNHSGVDVWTEAGSAVYRCTGERATSK